MDRALLPHLSAVLAVARTRSFARAAAELGIRPSAVSHAVRAAETRIGVPLFARTTRSVALTEAGALLVASAARAFADLDAAVEQLHTRQREVTGVLRINAPRLALPLRMTSLLTEMARRHPRLTVEVIADDALVDIVAAGFDAGVRLGEMIAQDMVAVRLTPPFRAIVVASPTYLAAHGTPASLAALAAHNCIGFRLLHSGALYEWDLRDAGREVRVSVTGTARVSDPLYARDLALADIGIAYLHEPLVTRDLAQGRLVEILPEASIVEPGLFLYFPRRASEARKLRAFIDVVGTVGSDS